MGKSRKHVKYRNFAIIRCVFANARKKNGRATSLGPHAVSRCAPIAAADAPQAHTNHLRTRTSQALVKTARPHASQLLRKSTCANTNLAPENALRTTQPLQKRQNAREDASVIAKITKRTRIERFYDMPIVSEGRYYSLFGNMGINGGYLRESSSAVDTFRAICESEDAARCIFIAQTSKSPASRHLNNEKYSGIGKPRPQGKQPNTQSFRASKAHRILYLKKPRHRTA